jgi:hypothetical protein
MKKTTPEKLKASPIKVELDPDAWPKFEKLIKSAAKMGHKPHDGKQSTKKGKRETS